MRISSSRQWLGWLIDAAKSESTPEPIVGSGIMGNRACPFGSMKGNWLFGNWFPLVSTGQSVGFGTLQTSLKLPWRFSSEGTELMKFCGTFSRRHSSDQKKNV